MSLTEDFEVLTPRTSKRGRIWKEGCAEDRVKMRALGWAPTLMTIAVVEQHVDVKMAIHTERPGEDESAGGDASGSQRWPGAHPKTGESRSTGPLTVLKGTTWPSTARTMNDTFLWCNHSAHCTLFLQRPQADHPPCQHPVLH